MLYFCKKLKFLILVKYYLGAVNLILRSKKFSIVKDHQIKSINKYGKTVLCLIFLSTIDIFKSNNIILSNIRTTLNFYQSKVNFSRISKSMF